jgi:hypothetical protein
LFYLASELILFKGCPFFQSQKKAVFSFGSADQDFKVLEGFFSGIELAVQTYRQCGHIYEFPGMDKNHRSL